MDFTYAPSPAERQYESSLLVRDLLSVQALLAVPCPNKSAATDGSALTALFLGYGAPRMVKSDSRSALAGKAFATQIARHRVTRMASPSRYLRYDGACRAGDASSKIQAHHPAARAGRPGRWTLEDFEAARLPCSEIGQPGGAGGPTPA